MEFWLAWYRISPMVRQTSWGVVVTDPRYPLIYDANQAGILTGHDEISADDVLAQLTPALREARAVYQHVEFWDPADPCPALEDIAAASDERHWDVDMVFEERSVLQPSPDVDVRVVDPADPKVWPVYTTTQKMYGDDLPEDVVEQMNRRFLEVVVPTGLTMFAAFVDGEIAGFVNLVSLAGIGYLDAVVTLPPFRRRGVATTAVMHVVERSLDRGDRLVHLLADEGDAPQRLYERLGFRVRARVGSATKRLQPADG